MRCGSRFLRDSLTLGLPGNNPCGFRAPIEVIAQTPMKIRQPGLAQELSVHFAKYGEQPIAENRPVANIAQ